MRDPADMSEEEHLYWEDLCEEAGLGPLGPDTGDPPPDVGELLEQVPDDYTITLGGQAGGYTAHIVGDVRYPCAVDALAQNPDSRERALRRALLLTEIALAVDALDCDGEPREEQCRYLGGECELSCPVISRADVDSPSKASWDRLVAALTPFLAGDGPEIAELREALDGHFGAGWRS